MSRLSSQGSTGRACTKALGWKREVRGLRLPSRGPELLDRAECVEGGDPAEVAEVVVRVAEDRAPLLRYRVGSDARWVPVLKRLLPQKAFAIGMRKRFNLGRPHNTYKASRSQENKLHPGAGKAKNPQTNFSLDD